MSVATGKRLEHQTREHASHSHSTLSEALMSQGSESGSGSLGTDGHGSFMRAKTLLDSLSKAAKTPIFGPQGSTNALAMSLSKSLGKSWSRDSLLESLAMHLDPKSPFLASSPGTDLQQFAMLEDEFCKDFTCCGIQLDSMHDLLQHYEEYHVRCESDFDEEFDDDDNDEDIDDDDGEDEHGFYMPFNLEDMDHNDDMDMEMDDFDVVSAQQQQEFNTAFLKAQIAAMSINQTPQQQPMTPTSSASGILPSSSNSNQISRATVFSVLGNATSPFHPHNTTSSFSEIQKHDKLVDDFRITRTEADSPLTLKSHFTMIEANTAFEDTLIHNTIGPPGPSRQTTLITFPTSDSDLEEFQSAPSADPDRPFKCKVSGCGKEYKNANGLKYHMRNGHAQETGDTEVDSILSKPYQCMVTECGKRYKNLNGLKYHIQKAHVELLEAGTDFGESDTN